MHGKSSIRSPRLSYLERSSAQETVERYGTTPEGVRILDEFNRLYEFTGVLDHSVRHLAPGIRTIHETVRRPVRILDIGTRDGALLRHFDAFGAQENIPLELHGMEFRADIAALARNRCSKGKFQIQIHYDPGEEFSSFHPGCFDVVCSTFMLHHRDPLEIQRTLDASMQWSRFSVFHLDLVRSLFSIITTWSAFTALGLRASRADAVLSCRRAFRKSELMAIVKTLKWENQLRVRNAFPIYLIVERNFGGVSI